MALRTIGICALLAAVTLILGEMLARVYDWTPSSRDAAVGDNLGQWRYYHSPSGYGDLTPHQDGHWVTWYHRPYHVQTNSAGLRNIEEPSTRAFRILAVGDSQTFGPYLANEDTWPLWAENYLRQKFGDADMVQVFNAGIAGYTIADEFAYLREKGLGFGPRLVVLAVFENDLKDLLKEKNGIVQRPAGGALNRIEATLKALGRSSALVSVAEQIKTRIQFAGAGVDVRRGEGEIAAQPRANPVGPDLVNELLASRYGVLFREAMALLWARGIALAVIFIPDAHVAAGLAASEVEPVIRSLTQATGTPYLDLTGALSAQADPAARLYLLQKDVRTGQFVGNGHLSREGNAVIGRAVAEWLLNERLVKP